MSRHDDYLEAAILNRIARRRNQCAAEWGHQWVVEVRYVGETVTRCKLCGEPKPEEEA